MDKGSQNAILILFVPVLSTVAAFVLRSPVTGPRRDFYRRLWHLLILEVAILTLFPVIEFHMCREGQPNAHMGILMGSLVLPMLMMRKGWRKTSVILVLLLVTHFSASQYAELVHTDSFTGKPERLGLYKTASTNRVVSSDWYTPLLGLWRLEENNVVSIIKEIEPADGARPEPAHQTGND